MQDLSLLHARTLIQSFIQMPARRRWLTLLDMPVGRQKLRKKLAHCEQHFDSRFVKQIPTGDQTHDGICLLLSKHATPELCFVLSEDPQIDGSQMTVKDALDHVLGQGLATFLSLIPGELAYYEGEDINSRYLCHRT